MIPNGDIIRTLNYNPSSTVSGQRAAPLPSDLAVTSIVSYEPGESTIGPLIRINTDGILSRDEQNLRNALPPDLVDPQILVDQNAIVFSIDDPGCGFDILHALSCLRRKSQTLNSLATPIAAAQRLGIVSQ
jgi:hypothetical protein